MAKYASEVIKVAKSWLGKNEADGTFKSIIDLYNNHKPLAQGYKVKYTDEWCATFVSAVSIKLGYTSIIPTECSCQRMIELFKNIGCWVENENRTPAAGDIIFYDWQDSGTGDNVGWADHVGIVEKVSGGTITVIEGNYGGKVARREIAVNSKYIRGYAVPKYDKEPVKTESVAGASGTAKKNINAIATEVIAGKWSTGAERKKKLKAAGYSDAEITQIQKTVNNMLGSNSIAYFERYNGTSLSIVDGLKAIGVNTSFNYRKQIAAANGINSYCGTAAENSKLMSLLKSGKLIRP